MPCDTDEVPGVSVPLVGVTTYRHHAAGASWDRPGAVVATSYVDCVSDGGGRAVMLPPLEGPGVRSYAVASASAEDAAAAAMAVAERLDAPVLVGRAGGGA